MKNKLVYDKLKEYEKEGWEPEGDIVWAYGEKFPQVDPLAIHLKTYRVNESHETRYQAMKRAFEILWPSQILTYNYWMERIFREHCDFNTEIFTLAAGGGVGKTQAVAYAGGIFFLALPTKRAVVVTSTTLDSLKKRIYGYIDRALQEAVICPPLRRVMSPQPSITLVNAPDMIHGIFGIAAIKGKDEDTIKNIIGHHPKNAYLLVLDECTDMPLGIVNAIPNLKKALEDRFQAIGIGNANEWTDLHGALSMPEVGIENIDPHKDFRWKTTQPSGYCLYFNPYDSPAIHEPDPIKKKALSIFLPTEEKLIKAERDEGTESESFWRFTMGYWRSKSTAATVVSEQFLKDYDPTHLGEFSGKYPLIMCAGLDPAFSTGGDKCILRLGVLGHHVNGKMILDYRGNSLIFQIQIRANTGKSAELQIADEVITICEKYKVPLNTLCVDASGQGRGLADVIQLRSGGGFTPTKIYSTNVGTRNVKAFDVHISSAHEMWFKGREFISHGQIFGMDSLSYQQLHSRLIIDKGGKKLLEKKDEYKKRMAVINSNMGRSPDEADAAMLCLQSAVLHHGFFPGQTKETKVYANEMSMKFDIAKEQYMETLRAKNVYNVRPTYKKGIESILRKKHF